MKLFELIFVLLINIVSAKINIKIIAGKNVSDAVINFSGHDLKVVTDYEINLFGINDERIFGAVQSHYGVRPRNVYLKSPTPWGDLYKQYLWEQVSRVLSVKSASVKNIVKEPVAVLYQDLDNVSNKTIKVTAAMTQNVENTVSTVWTKNTEIAVTQEIEYGLNVLFAKASGTTGFSFTSSWGKSEEKSEVTSIGTTASMETELKPGQSATAVLSANRGYMEIEVIYTATLRGHLAVNFKRKHNGHHFWFPTIDSVMKSGGLTNERTAVEIIKIGFYTDASLKVYDKESGLPV